MKVILSFLIALACFAQYIPTPNPGEPMRHTRAIGLDLLSAGAKCDSNGTTGNGTDDRTAIQSAFDSIDTTNGGMIIVPAGKICRISDYVHIHASKLTITGGGTLFFDPPLVSSHPTFTKYQSYMYATGLIISKTGCTLAAQSDPDDATTARSASPITDITLKDFTVMSVGSAEGLVWNSQAEPNTNIPLNHSAIHVWCADRVTIENVTIKNFYTDALEIWGVTNASIRGNIMNEVAFNGIGAWATSDVNVTANVFNDVAQPIEAGLLRWNVIGNTFTNVTLTGVLGGYSSAVNNVRVVVSGNTLHNGYSHGYPIKINCSPQSPATCMKNVVVTNNSLLGTWGSGAPVTLGAAASDGIVVVANNSASDTLSAYGTMPYPATFGTTGMGQGKNLLRRIFSLDNGAYWSIASGAITFTTGQEDPFGETNAFKMEATQNNSGIYQSLTANENTSYYLSVWVKSAAMTEWNLKIYDGTQNLTKTVTVGTDWTRVGFAFTTRAGTGTTTLYCYLGINNKFQTGDIIYVSHPQLNYGSSPILLGN